jgi:hypothetical protein
MAVGAISVDGRQYALKVVRTAMAEYDAMFPALG